MNETCVLRCRSFSQIRGCQAAYSLLYCMEPLAAGCRLTICRTGSRPMADVLCLPHPASIGRALLDYLSENAVQPELWRAVTEDLIPQMGVCGPAEGR